MYVYTNLIIADREQNSATQRHEHGVTDLFLKWKSSVQDILRHLRHVIFTGHGTNLVCNRSKLIKLTGNITFDELNAVATSQLNTRVNGAISYASHTTEAIGLAIRCFYT